MDGFKLIMPKLPALIDLLSYQNNRVIHQFCKEYPECSLQDSQQLFNDLLGWLWLTTYRLEKQTDTRMFGPLLKLDKMWHVFILHTRDYMQFCHTYFTEYLHHEVENSSEEQELTNDELADFLGDCYDHLGENWLARNFDM